MTLPFQPDPVDDKEMGKLNNIEQSLKKEEEKLSEVTYELDGVHRVRLCPWYWVKNLLKIVVGIYTCTYRYMYDIR